MRLLLTVVAWLCSAVSAFAQPATPCTPNGGGWAYTTTTVTFYRCAADGQSWIAVGVVGPNIAWGAITGTLSSQIDLQTALNGKQASGAYATGTGTANGTNTGDQTITLTGGVTGTGTGSFAATVITNANLTGNVTSVGNATTYAAVVPYALGGIGACAATSATTGTITVNMTTPCVTVTPTGAMTFNASGGVAGQILVFSITTSGASSFTLTWGTNFRKTGTLATGTTTARFFTVTFLCLDGTTWTEIARTAVQT